MEPVVGLLGKERALTKLRDAYDAAVAACALTDS
jgi:hypothetical protein